MKQRHSYIGSVMGSAAAVVKSSFEPSQKTLSETIAHYQARTQSKQASEMSLLKSFLYGSVSSVFLTTSWDKEPSQPSTDRRTDKEIQSVVYVTLEMPDFHHNNRQGRSHQGKRCGRRKINSTCSLTCCKREKDDRYHRSGEQNTDPKRLGG